MYRVRLIIAQYAQRYDGQYAPNVVDAWDEYALDDNHDGYAESLAKHWEMVGTDYDWVRELDVTVPQDVVFNLATVPRVQGVTEAP